MTTPAPIVDSVGFRACLDSVGDAWLRLVERLVVRNASEIGGHSVAELPKDLAQGRSALNGGRRRAGCLESVHPSHFCHNAAADQGHF